MVYGETGVFPLAVEIKSRLINYWAKLLTCKQTKLDACMYRILYAKYTSGEFRSPWLQKIHSILDQCGLGYIWIEHNFTSVRWLSNTVKRILKDQWTQEWNSTINNSVKCYNYRIYKTVFQFENYITDLPFKYWRALCRFRTCNHKLPVEREEDMLT